MADLSKLLHDAGQIVTMAPPESYLDVQTTEFSRYVNLTYPETWPDETPANKFQYHGHNAYGGKGLKGGFRWCGSERGADGLRVTRK